MDNNNGAHLLLVLVWLLSTLSTLATGRTSRSTLTPLMCILMSFWRHKEWTGCEH